MDKTTVYYLTKIIDRAANGDTAKAITYVRHFCERLQSDGDTEGAEHLRKILNKVEVGTLALRKLSGSDPGKNPPVDSESRLPTADVERPSKSEIPLFLDRETRAHLDQFLTFYRASDRFLARGVEVSASLLLYGPPGCGKTQVARYVAADLGLPLVTARIDSLVSSYLGSTSKNIRYLFDYASENRCVLFLDEFDALAKMRDDSRELGELKRVVISLLQNLDSMGKDQVIIAATNHDHLLDSAIWRRFAYRIHLTEPDFDARLDMARHFFGTMATEEVVRTVAALTRGLSGAQIRQVVDDSVRTAILSDRDTVPLPEVATRTLAMFSDFKQHTSLDDRIRFARALDPKRITQEKLAGIFGVSQTTVSRHLRERVDQ